MNLHAFRRFLRPLLTSLGCLAITLGLTSCVPLNFTILHALSATVGGTFQELKFTIFPQDLEKFDLDGNIEIDFLGQDGTPAEDITLTGAITVVPGSTFTDIIAHVDIDANAGARRVLARMTLRPKGVFFLFYGPVRSTIDLTISNPNGPLPPRVTGVAAVGGGELMIQRGQPTRVEITGENFDDSAEVFALDGALVSDVVYDDDSGNVLATITTPERGRTGRQRFNLQTDSGRSDNFELVVSAAATGAPRIDGIFPNFVYPGPATVEFTMIGSNLQNPTQLLVDPIEAVTNAFIAELNPNQARPGSQLYASFKLPAPATPSALNLSVTTEEGTLSTNTVPISVLDPANPTEPQILTVNGYPPGTYSGAVVQFQIAGARFGPSGPTSLIHFSPLYDNPILSVRLFKPSTPQAAESSVVVQMDLAPIVVQPLNYSANLALNVNGLVTRTIALNFAPPPTEGPFVSSTSIGEIERGESVEETIHGVGLTNVTGILFTANQAGITVSNIVQSTDGGASFKATFTASPTAALTGDTLTRFRVVTQGNVQSQDAAYIVLP